MNMKFLPITILASMILMLSACDQQKDPTACDCYAALQSEGTESTINDRCVELKKDSTFLKMFSKCASDAILKGNTKVTRMEGNQLELPETGNFAMDTDASAISWSGEKITGKNHQGDIRFKSGSLNFANGQLSGGSFKIDMSSIAVSDIKDEGSKAKLEGHLNSPDFFDTAKFPEASYTITEVIARENSSFEVKGDLTIKGITESVTSNILLTLNNNKIVGGGTMTFDRSKFDVRYGSGSFFDDLGDDLIKDNITIKLKVIANNA